jgi:hypothetical protein
MYDDPGSNYGWMLRSGIEGTSNTARQFEANDFAAFVPVLDIEYTPIPEPGTAALAATAIGILVVRMRRRVASGAC